MRLFALLLFLTLLNLQGLDFQPCYEKNSNAIFTIDGKPAIAVGKNRVLLMTDKRPENLKGFKYLKGNKFLGFILLESEDEYEYIKLVPTERYLKADEVAVIEKNGYQVGKVQKRQKAFELAQFSKETPKGSVIGIKCYAAIGIGAGENGFIETKYINFFLNNDPFAYGDIGVRFLPGGTIPAVVLTDPYRRGVALRRGDLIKEIDGVKVESALEVQDIVIFSKPGDYLKVKFERDGKEMSKDVLVYKLLGDSYDNETFLERFGLKFDENLKVIEVKEGSLAQKRYLKIGDQLKQVENTEVFTPYDTAGLLSQMKKIDAKFIFERDEFQFFITLKEK